MDRWPELDWNAWQPTADTLHLWTQVVGKTRMLLHPRLPHWWHVTLYVSARGLTTRAIPTQGEMLEIEFDFLAHQLQFRLSSGPAHSTPLRAQSVADFYFEFQQTLTMLGVAAPIDTMPAEIPGAIPFDQDTQHATYDPDAAQRFWRVLMSADEAFQRFSSNFLGKMSPVHFFWGSFDLAVTRFSGRRAPERKDADLMTREAYSHEVISAGFWPGNGGYGEPAFYCYAAPVPAGLAGLKVEPSAAYYDTKMGEFLLRYSDLRKHTNPDRLLHAFLESTYSAAADEAGWDRAALERSRH